MIKANLHYVDWNLGDVYFGEDDYEELLKAKYYVARKLTDAETNHLMRKILAHNRSCR